MNQTAPVLSVKGLSKSFLRKKEKLKAVSNVSLDLYPGETLGLVGESGCGKSTLARCVLRLIEPDQGEVLFQGQDLLHLNSSSLRQQRKDIQMIFQDPYSSLNPRMTIGEMIAEPLKIHKLVKSDALNDRVDGLLTKVGLKPHMKRRYPHEFSGGQRQRAGIARALALNPRLIVADEPVSALDVSVQAQILNLLKSLQKDHGMAYLFIAHDLRVVEYLSDRIAVMYLGKIVEEGPAVRVINEPRHPYTKALLQSVPKIKTTAETLPEQTPKRLKGDVPNAVNPPSGCAFHPRCPVAESRCAQEEPLLKTNGQDQTKHQVACFLEES